MNGTLELDAASFTGNSSDSGSGGGVLIYEGHAKINDTTFADNRAGGSGGGLYLNEVTGVKSTVTNSTFSGNAAASGGGIRSFGFGMILTNVTIASNTGGGGVQSDGPLSSRNSIFAHNSPRNCTGSFTSQGNNLSSDPTCTGGGSDRTGTDPRLGELADNGGPTKTRALLDGSPAIDAAGNTNAPAVDQRGVSRPQDGDGDGQAAHDIGAFEKEGVPPKDTTPPRLALPADITQEATSEDGAEVAYTAMATDEDPVNPEVDCSPASGSIFPIGDTTVNCSATDAAGNPAEGAFNVKVQDTTAPVIASHDDVTEEATGPDGANVDYTSPATSDAVDGNGTADCSPASGSTFELGDTTVTCTAQDAAGNQATPTTFEVTVEDTIRPTDIQFVGNINDGDSFYFGDVPAEPTCTATDGGSGLQSCVVSGHSTDVGTHTLTATATDKAGNSVTKEITYTVKAWTFEGFYQPVDMNGVYNTVKGGSTVPFKFELFEGTTELTDTAYLSQPLQATMISCSTGVTEDVIELTATGATSLRYDTTGGQFIYNWKTPTGAGSCYKVTITADDGSSQTAFFKLK